MPAWWRACWRRRYPCGVDGNLVVYPNAARWADGYRVTPLSCGCGYRVEHGSQRIGRGHYPTLGAAIRAARRHARGAA